MASLTMLLQYVRVSKKYHYCFVKTMKLLHAFIVHLFNSFCEKKCVVAFFNVGLLQQQTIGEVENLIVFVGR